MAVKRTGNFVLVQRIWPDGETLNFQVQADSAYPDALDQAKHVAVEGFAEALGVVLSADAKYDAELGDGD